MKPNLSNLPNPGQIIYLEGGGMIVVIDVNVNTPFKDVFSFGSPNKYKMQGRTEVRIKVRYTDCIVKLITELVERDTIVNSLGIEEDYATFLFTYS